MARRTEVNCRICHSFSHLEKDHKKNDLVVRVLDKLAKEHCEQQNKEILTWKEFTRDRASGMSFMRVERAVVLALSEKQAEVEEAINSIEQTKSRAWKCSEDEDEFEDAVAFLRKRLLEKEVK